MSVNVGNSEFRPLPTNPNAKITGVHESLLQECEKDIIWYRDNFFGKGIVVTIPSIVQIISHEPHLVPRFSAHQNYLSLDSPRGPLAISLIHDPETRTYKALLRTTAGSERLSVSSTTIPISLLRRIFSLGPTIPSLMGGISRNIPVKNLRMCKDANLPNELLAMEERQVIRSYKFGVTYLAPGQSLEEEMFQNKMGMYWSGAELFPLFFFCANRFFVLRGAQLVLCGALALFKRGALYFFFFTLCIYAHPLSL